MVVEARVGRLTAHFWKDYIDGVIFKGRSRANGYAVSLVFKKHGCDSKAILGIRESLYQFGLAYDKMYLEEYGKLPE